MAGLSVWPVATDSIQRHDPSRWRIRYSIGSGTPVTKSWSPNAFPTDSRSSGCRRSHGQHPQQLVGLVAERRPVRRTGERDPSVGVEDRDEIMAVLDQCPEAALGDLRTEPLGDVGDRPDVSGETARRIVAGLPEVDHEAVVAVSVADAVADLRRLRAPDAQLVPTRDPVAVIGVYAFHPAPAELRLGSPAGELVPAATEEDHPVGGVGHPHHHRRVVDRLAERFRPGTGSRRRARGTDVDHDPLHGRLVEQVRQHDLQLTPRPVTLATPCGAGRGRGAGLRERDVPRVGERGDIVGVQQIPAQLAGELGGREPHDVLDRRAHPLHHTTRIADPHHTPRVLRTSAHVTVAVGWPRQVSTLSRRKAHRTGSLARQLRGPTPSAGKGTAPRYPSAPRRGLGARGSISAVRVFST